MLSSALIGYTGFVGGNLDRQMKFTHKYNSENISDISGEEFDLLVCAGVTAAKWLANSEPQKDKANIDRLIKNLGTVKAKKLVLISTIDVYPAPLDVDEFSDIDISRCHPYGRHRLSLEGVLSEQFATHIIRLPGLFGHGLKKNVIYDFLSDNEVHKIHPDGEFQFYCLDRIGHDVARVVEQNIELINIASEPLTVAEVSEVCLGKVFHNPGFEGAAPVYRTRSAYAGLFGGSNGFMYSKQQVLGDLGAYVAALRP